MPQKKLKAWKTKFNTIRNSLIDGKRKGRKEDTLDGDTMDKIMSLSEKRTTKELGFSESDAFAHAKRAYQRASDRSKTPKKKKDKDKNGTYE